MEHTQSTEFFESCPCTYRLEMLRKTKDPLKGIPVSAALTGCSARFEYHPLWRLTTKQKTPLEGVSVSAERFELSTNGLKGRCSAVELRARHNGGLHSNMVHIQRQRKRT